MNDVKDALRKFQAGYDAKNLDKLPDFKFDIEGAHIEARGDVAWFFTNATVKDTFLRTQAEHDNWASHMKDLVENAALTPKQRISLINWQLALHYNLFHADRAEELSCADFSGMLVREDCAWKIVTLHFSSAKPTYPDERLEESPEYLGEFNYAANIMSKHSYTASKELVDLINNQDDFFVKSEHIVATEIGHFSWVIALGFEKKRLPKEEILAATLKQMEEIFVSNAPSQEKIFKAQRTAAYALKEMASGEEFTWTKRLTAVVEKTNDGLKLRHAHFSYPFNWILEGKNYLS